MKSSSDICHSQCSLAPPGRSRYSNNTTLSTFTKRHSRERSFEMSLDNILDKCSESASDTNFGDVKELVPGRKIVTNLKKSHFLGSAKSNIRRKPTWYSVLSPSYKSRSDDFRKLFKVVQKDERLIVDYSCALQKDILAQGRMYISQNWICFYANIFRWETLLTIRCKDITAITKEKTALVIPNAIQITTDTEKFFFTSYAARDKTYLMLFRIWQNSLMEQPMVTQELWQWIRYNYGDDLGLASSDDEFICRPLAAESAEDKDSNDDPIIKTELPFPLCDNGSTAQDEGIPPELLGSCGHMKAVCTMNVLPAVSSLLINGCDSTDVSDSEVECCGHDHLEKLYLDEVFNISVDKLFKNLFSDSDFFRHFVLSRKTFEVHLPGWQDALDENGDRVRNIQYTLTLNNSIGPRTSPSTEKQVCHGDSQPGRWYCVDCQCHNDGIPYSDSFYVQLRYCMTRVSAGQCRLRVTCQLIFCKPILGMFKRMIEKSAANGMTDYFRSLSAHLRLEAEETRTNHAVTCLRQVGKKHKKRWIGHSSLLDGLHRRDRPKFSQLSPSCIVLAKDGETVTIKLDTILCVLLLIFVCLLLINTVLFYKLQSLRTSAASSLNLFNGLDIDGQAASDSEQNWDHLLEQQQVFHGAEMCKWKDALTTSAKLIVQTKKSLAILEQHLH